MSYRISLPQPTDNVEVCQFLLQDEARWKSMSRDAIMSVCGSTATPLWPQFPTLCAPTVDATLASNDLEQQLRILVTEHRRVWYTYVKCVFDEHLFVQTLMIS